MIKIILEYTKSAGEHYWDFTKRKYPEQAAKGYIFKTNIDRDSSKSKRRTSKQWCKRFLKYLYFDDEVFTILFGVIREDLPAYYRKGDGELKDLCPVFGKMREVHQTPENCNL
jgi:hypothetical protein